MMKNLQIIAIAALIILCSCKKDEPLTGTADTSVAYVSFTNVNASSKYVNVYADGAKINNVTFLAPFATLSGTYAGLQPGTRNVTVQDTSTATPITYYNGSLTLAGGQSYSFYLFDIVSGGQLKGILLSTDRTADPNNKAKVRFLNFSPGSPALDFWLIRRETAVPKDSMLVLGGIPYVGNVSAPSITMLSGFSTVNPSVLASGTTPASDYIIRAKISGTGTIVASTAATTLVNKRNYTIFARGIYPAVTLTTMLNN